MKKKKKELNLSSKNIHILSKKTLSTIDKVYYCKSDGLVIVVFSILLITKS